MLIGGRLRRPFRGGAFLRTSASPRGGAMTALPLHGIYGVLQGVFCNLHLETRYKMNLSDSIIFLSLSGGVANAPPPATYR